jgi:NAD(P)-dependent dehydrogenase (short-subunit alcohol dehydrogenase family)
MQRLAGKVAVITGATSGIGRGVARRFVREGAVVYFAARGEAAGRETEAELREIAAPGAGAVFIAADLGDRETVTGVIRRAVQDTGRIDVLVNNGQGIPPLKSLLNKPDDEFDYALRTGLYATKWMMTEAFPTMRDQGGGSIINMSSVYGLTGVVNGGDYSATKEAIRAITRTAANEWGRYNIRVNVVNPAAESAGLANWAKANPEFYRNSLELIPLKRYGDPEQDLGGLVLGLATDDARFITGQTFGGDGGMSMIRRKRSGTEIEGVDFQKKAEAVESAA